MSGSRSFYRYYQEGKLSRAELTAQRKELETRLQEVVDNPPAGHW